MILETKARLEDEVESLQSKSTLTGQRSPTSFTSCRVDTYFPLCVVQVVTRTLSSLSVFLRGPQRRERLTEGTGGVIDFCK